MIETITAEEYRALARGRSAKPPKICEGCGRPKAACRCLEEALAAQVRHAGLPEPVAQFRAIPGRRFRWDLAWPDRLLLLEIQGGVYLGGEGGHTSAAGFTRDAEKRSLAAIAGYRTIECTGDQVRDGICLRWIETALAGDET